MRNYSAEMTKVLDETYLVYVAIREYFEKSHNCDNQSSIRSYNSIRYTSTFSIVTPSRLRFPSDLSMVRQA